LNKEQCPKGIFMSHLHSHPYSRHRTQHIIIVGAGIGGLSAAIRLAAQGYHVQVVERQPQIGGKLNSITREGFHFDTGPSLITMPYVLHDLFQAARCHLEDYLDLVPLDITCRYFYRDGLVLNAWRDQQLLAAEFARVNPYDAESLKRFTAYSGNMFQAAADPFLYHSLGNPLDVMGTFLRFVLNGTRGRDKSITTLMGRVQAVFDALAPVTLDQQVRKFFKDGHIRQLFDRYATYNGSSPYHVASVYSIIPYVELAWGGWYIQGGIYSLAQALGKLASDLGVCIETNCAVRRILVERSTARGVVLTDGRVLYSDAVIANSDVVTTHRELLSPAVFPERQARRLERLEPSCSAFVLMLGVDKQYPQLSHHNIFFSDDYRAEFDDLFVRHIPQRDPTIYICASTQTDATQAPPGCENLFVLVNAPYLTESSNWKRDASAYRDNILNILASYPQTGLHDLREHIICEEMLTPDDFREKYGANRGSIYGLSSNTRLAPFTRPGNRSRTIQHLYFVGGSTHPGGGVPLVTLSGKIAAQMIVEDNKVK
jgi:phytoene desaturase